MSEHTESLPVAVAPENAGTWIVDAVRAGGGRVVPEDEAQALIWGGGPAEQLSGALDGRADISWVQLPSAGIERYADLIGDGRTWTAAKGIYGLQVAEHALALALAGLHKLPQLARAHQWKKTVCRDLYGANVTILGGGGIAQHLLELVGPFHVVATVIRRTPQPMSDVAEVLPPTDLKRALSDADLVFLALPLTPETEGIIAEPELRAMKDDAWLVNVGRGKLIKTDDLVRALREGWIGGAALDVTDPEPLPDGHPLWSLDNCLITPHCANSPEMEQKSYAELVERNVRRRIAGEQLEGLVDPEAGY